VYSWIIDHETRELVWHLDDDDTERSKGRRYLRRAETTEDLDAGKYELYLYAGENWFGSVKVVSPGDLLGILGDVFDHDDEHEYYDDYVEDCYVKLSSSELSA
jgi:hypothetical protein